MKKMKKVMKRSEFYVFLIILILSAVIQARSGQFYTNNNIVDIARSFLDTNGAHQETDVEVLMPSEQENYFKKIASREVADVLKAAKAAGDSGEEDFFAEAAKASPVRPQCLLPEGTGGDV